MEPQNPYLAPNVEETVSTPLSETLFEYRYSSRNVLSFIGSLPIAFACIAMLGIVYRNRAAAPVVGPAEKFYTMAVCAFLLSGLCWAIALFIWPRVFEFRVDREFVTWRTPWPRATDVSLPITSIDRVEYQGRAITVVTADGNRHCPGVYSYGQASEEVVEAIAAAVAEREPQTVVHRTNETTSVSLMRWLGEVVGRYGSSKAKHRD